MDEVAGRTATHCPYCALQCGQWVSPPGEVDARAVYATGDDPTGGGGMCQKGWTSSALLTHAHRLTSPQVRDSRTAGFRETDRAGALGTVAARPTALRAEHGPDAVAVLGGGGLTNEKAYLLGKFARVALGTSKIDYNGRFCMSSAAAAGNRAFGVDRGQLFPVTDLDDAELVVLTGANVAETMPPLMAHLSAARLVVIDPRRTPTAERAIASGGLHLAPRPGTDAALALGMLHAAVVDGHLDRSYLDARTTGFDDVWRVASQWWPERAERVCGVAASDMRTVVRRLAASRRRYVLTARGAEQHAHGVDTVTAWINLALALGLLGRPGSGSGRSPGRATGRAGASTGRRPTSCPATGTSPIPPRGSTSRRCGASTRPRCRARGAARRAAGLPRPARRTAGAAGVRVERAGLRPGRAGRRRTPGRAGRAGRVPGGPAGGVRRAAPGVLGRARRLHGNLLRAARRRGGAALAVPVRRASGHAAAVHRAGRPSRAPTPRCAGRPRGGSPRSGSAWPPGSTRCHTWSGSGTPGSAGTRSGAPPGSPGSPRTSGGRRGCPRWSRAGTGRACSRAPGPDEARRAPGHGPGARRRSGPAWPGPGHSWVSPAVAGLCHRSASAATASRVQICSVGPRGDITWSFGHIEGGSVSGVHSAEAVQFWRSVELFDPQKVPDRSRVGPDELPDVFDLPSTGPLPWQAGHEAGRRDPGSNREWQFVVYAGLFEMQKVQTEITQVLGPGVAGEERGSVGDSAMFAFVVGADGFLVEDSALLSSTAWSVGRLRNPGPGAANWLDGFDAEEEAFIKALNRLSVAGGVAAPPAGGGSESAQQETDVADSVTQRVLRAAGRHVTDAAGEAVNKGAKTVGGVVTGVAAAGVTGVAGPLVGAYAGSVAGTFVEKLMTIDRGESVDPSATAPGEDEVAAVEPSDRPPGMTMTVEYLDGLVRDLARALHIEECLGPSGIRVEMKAVSIPNAGNKRTGSAKMLNSFIREDLG